MTLYVYKVTIYGGQHPVTHKGVLFANDFHQAMFYLGEAYDPEMGEVYLAAVDDTTVLEISPKEWERISSEGAFNDEYTVL